MTGEIEARLREYLSGGGLFNPELADHSAVRGLLIDARDALSLAGEENTNPETKETK